MHILDDLDGFSDRARELLARTGRREAGRAAGVPTDLLRVRDRTGRLIPAPTELVVSREAFRARYRGLRYAARRSALVGGRRRDIVRSWEFDLADGVWPDGRGWCFAWTGERVSSPVNFLAHTDGRIGVGDGAAFIEVAASVSRLIESHAVMDAVSSWDPWPGSLEAWVPSDAGVLAAERVEGLTPVAEASGPHDTWLLSDHVAVHAFSSWTGERARRRAVRIWSRGEEGRRQVRAAFRDL
ncbi:hypothetical protein [Marinitenerispora sediminis]|uniref:hypothetical protein n=1 Tax=Marinitenerispora sediminis TaxID=1931232 RepID=UPI00131443A3|nr:hypothetical protein [Marinitenerispora sediminis]